MKKACNTRYTETVAFEMNAIGSKCIVLNLEQKWVPTPFPKNPMWIRIHEIFNIENFLYPCPPLDLGRIHIEPVANRVLRCPIKKSGDSKIYLPLELECCLDLVRFVVETELYINQNFKKFHAHISYEHTEVKANKTQRKSGWHVDGFQGVRAIPHQIEHSYIWSDRYSTEYCLQPFFIKHLDSTRHNIFPEIEKQAKENNLVKGIDEHVCMIDPYVVHRSPVIPKTCKRTFVRITFSETELEDPMNTKNLGIKMKQNYEPRIDVRDRLFEYDGEIPWNMYGVTNVPTAN